MLVLAAAGVTGTVAGVTGTVVGKRGMIGTRSNTVRKLILAPLHQNIFLHPVIEGGHRRMAAQHSVQHDCQQEGPPIWATVHPRAHYCQEPPLQVDEYQQAV